LKQEYVQNLAVVADFLTLEEVWSFLRKFGSNFAFAEICSQTFCVYPKFEYAYWFDWVLIVDDLTTARTKIKDCFGAGWIGSGGDEIWNAKNKTELAVPTWAILSEPNSCISVAEAHQLDTKPRLEPSQAFVSVSTTGKIVGNYSSISPDRSTD
jgi:hypothetical protein